MARLRAERLARERDEKHKVLQPRCTAMLHCPLQRAATLRCLLQRCATRCNALQRVVCVQLAALRRDEWKEGMPQSARAVPPKHQGYC